MNIITCMPTECRLQVMQAIFTPMPEPVLSIDIKGKIEFFNSSAALLFDQNRKTLIGMMISTLINDFDFNHWSNKTLPLWISTRVTIQGRDFLLNVTPIISSSDDKQSNIAGSIVMLKSTVHLNRQLKDQAACNEDAFNYFIASSSQRMRQLLHIAKKLAVLDAPLFIVGETGTGKALLAQACHLYGIRSHYPFLTLHCASLSDEVAESELFGYASGTYPNTQESKKGFFKQADGGSILLDEISEMSPNMQNKLLCFLNNGTYRRIGENRERHVDVRVICTAKKNLLDLVRNGRFREDLYYRLNVLSLTIPPLREHPEDIMPLVTMFIERFCEEQRIKRPKLASDTEAKLNCYSWPGNVRQLKNVLYSAIAQKEGEILNADDIDLPHFVPVFPISDNLLEGSLPDISKRFERSVLRRLYRIYPSTRKLAKRLGVSHTAIANKLREYDLSNKR